MARSDPMTALLSPAMGGTYSQVLVRYLLLIRPLISGSMQSQMEAKLASIKSPGLKSGLPASPTARNFTTNRQSLALDNSSNYLSPDSAAIQHDSAAATLAQQRAKLKANNAAHRISAPVLASPVGDGRASWGPSTLLSQVSEQQASPVQEIAVSVSRPKSTEFSGTVGTPRAVNNEATVPAANDSWASMVNTPLIPMFKKETRPPPAVDNAPKNDWHASAAPGVPRMGDPTIHRRNPPKGQQHDNRNSNNNDHTGGVYDDNGNPVNAGQGQQGQNAGRPSGMRNVSGNGAGWTGTRSPALNNNNQSNRFGDGSDAGGNNPNPNNMNGLGMQMGGFGMGLASPTMGMGIPGLGMQPMSPFNMLSMMNMNPDAAQLLAAQMAAGQFGQPGMAGWLGMQPMSAGLGPGMGGNMHGRKPGPGGSRSPGLRSASSVGSRGDGGGGNNTPKGEEDVDPALLNDVAAWLRSLRLHKYTPNFEGSKWQDMVMMDEAALEAKGVAALGARRKMLKTFELVRKKMGIDGGPPSSVPPTSAGLASP